MRKKNNAKEGDNRCLHRADDGLHATIQQDAGSGTVTREHSNATLATVPSPTRWSEECWRSKRFARARIASQTTLSGCVCMTGTGGRTASALCNRNSDAAVVSRRNGPCQADRLQERTYKDKQEEMHTCAQRFGQQQYLR